MPNDYHHLLSGPDLHPNKIDATTGTELTGPSQTTYDARWASRVRAIVTTAPLAGGGDLSADRTLSMAVATSSTNGYLSSVDWSRFNNKQPRTVITVGPSGSTGNDYTGNGTSDDVSLQNANNALTSGGAILLRSGSYVTSAPVAISSNVSVIGESAGSVTIATSMNPGNQGGVFTLSNKSNVLFERVGFNCSGSATAITSYGHSNLTIRGCCFTGSTTANGIVNFNGNSGLSNFTNTLIEGNTFKNIPNTFRTINLYPRWGNLVAQTRITGNHFESTSGPAIYLDAYDVIRDTTILGNAFLNLISGTHYYDPAVAVYGGIAVPNMVFSTAITGNTYRNALTTNTGQGFVYMYSSTGTVISSNTAVGAWTRSVNQAGPCIAPGRVADPESTFVITSNHIEGFDAPWDPDSTTNATVGNNTIYNCGTGFDLGYGTQKYVTIHDNVIYNSTQRVYNCALLLANSTPVKCRVINNTYIDDRATPSMMRFVFATGNYNFADVEIKGNKVYCPSGTLTYIARELGSEVLPRMLSDNEVHDSTGRTIEYVSAQGNVTGATTFTRANGPVVSASLTGNITVTLPVGLVKGEVFELRLTQDATGSRTVTWPSNFKKAGGSLNLSTAASATDVITMRFDGTNWIEVSRSLNVS